MKWILLFPLFTMTAVQASDWKKYQDVNRVYSETYFEVLKERSKVGNAIKNAESEKAEKEKAVFFSKNQLDTLVTRLQSEEAERAELQTKRDSVSDSISTSQQSIVSTATTRGWLETGAVLEKTSVLAAADSDVTAHRSEVDQAQAQLQQKQSELSQLQSDSDYLGDKSKLASLEQELSLKVSEISQAESRLGEIETLLVSLNQTQPKTDEIQNQILSLESERGEHQSTLQTAQARKTELTSEIQTVSQRIENHEQLISGAQSQVNEAREKRNGLQLSLLPLVYARTQVSDSFDRIALDQRQLVELDQEIQQAQQKTDATGLEVESAKADLAGKRSQLAQLTIDLSEVSSDLNRLVDQLAEAQSDLDDTVEILVEKNVKRGEL